MTEPSRRACLAWTALSALLALVIVFRVLPASGPARFLLDWKSHAQAAAYDRAYTRIAGMPVESPIMDLPLYEHTTHQLRAGGDAQYRRDVRAIELEFNALATRLFWFYGMLVALVWLMLVGAGYAAGLTAGWVRRRLRQRA